MPEKETVTTTAESDSKPDFTPITLESQADVERFMASRVKKATAKFADYDDLKTKAAELDTLKAASMTQSEKDVARIRELEAELVARDQALAAERHAGLRRDVAAAKGVPANRITGETKAELEQSADELLEWQKTAGPKIRVPVGSLRSGASNTDTQMDKKERAAAMLREYYGSRQH